MKFLVINGVNLNCTGKRERGVYGMQTLEQINDEIQAHFPEDEITFLQSNYEGEICTWLQQSDDQGYDGIVLNAGAYTHYSYAIHDAILCTSVPVIEVHMSNVASREEFRHTSVLSAVCKGTVTGFGKNSYVLALQSFKL